MKSLMVNINCLFFHVANLDKIRQSLASRHAETVQQNDVQRRLMRQERQKVFEEAFQSDMNYYKEVGKLPSKHHLYTKCTYLM